jgi:hypothetical protein
LDNTRQITRKRDPNDPQITRVYKEPPSTTLAAYTPYSAYTRTAPRPREYIPPTLTANYYPKHEYYTNNPPQELSPFNNPYTLPQKLPPFHNRYRPLQNTFRSSAVWNEVYSDPHAGRKEGGYKPSRKQKKKTNNTKKLRK